MATAPLPRGIRQNNPFNIRFSWANRWIGKVWPEGESSETPAFETFKEHQGFPAPVWGLRAGMILTRNHWRGKPDRGLPGARTIEALITLHAPAEDNNPLDAYIRYVATAVGVAPQAPVDISRRGIMRRFAHAVVQFENGQDPYAEDLYSQALDLADFPAEEAACK